MDALPKSADIVELTTRETPTTPLSVQVKNAVDQYLSQFNDHKITGLHAMVIGEVEKPLILATLEFTGHNQTKASEVLGLSRSTLRKKMEQYDIL
ncbi:MAG: helix-turn-helix domain-containing protein [Gammaproteobacteria bacterium]